MLLWHDLRSERFPRRANLHLQVNLEAIFKKMCCRCSEEIDGSF